MNNKVYIVLVTDEAYIKKDGFGVAIKEVDEDVADRLGLSHWNYGGWRVSDCFFNKDLAMNYVNKLLNGGDE